MLISDLWSLYEADNSIRPKGGEPGFSPLGRSDRVGTRHLHSRFPSRNYNTAHHIREVAHQAFIFHHHGNYIWFRE